MSGVLVLHGTRRARPREWMARIKISHVCTFLTYIRAGGVPNGTTPA